MCKNNVNLLGRFFLRSSRFDLKNNSSLGRGYTQPNISSSILTAKIACRVPAHFIFASFGRLQPQVGRRDGGWPPGW